MNEEISAKDLVDRLNTNFPKGKSPAKTLFTVNDVVHYIKRGNIPHKYGGNILEKNKIGNSVFLIVGNRRLN